LRDCTDQASVRHSFSPSRLASSCGRDRPDGYSRGRPTSGPDFCGKLGALRECPQLGPGDLWMAAAAEAAISASHYIFWADEPRETADTLRNQFRMFDAIGRVGDHARDEDFARRQLHILPNNILVLMPRIGSFDQVGLRPYPQHQVDELRQLDVEGVRPVPAAPAKM